MRVIIEKGSSGLYYTKDGVWTRNRNEALSFAEVTAAIDFVLTNGLDGVCPVVTQSSSGWQFRLPEVFRQRKKGEPHSHAKVS